MGLSARGERTRSSRAASQGVSGPGDAGGGVRRCGNTQECLGDLLSVERAVPVAISRLEEPFERNLSKLALVRVDELADDFRVRLDHLCTRARRCV